MRIPDVLPGVEYLVRISGSSPVFCGGGSASLLVTFIPRVVKLEIDQPDGSASIRIVNEEGLPGETYFTALTFDPSNELFGLGTGYWGGLWIPFGQLASQASSGAPPFIGVLDGAGGSSWSVPGGALPSLVGMKVYGVTHTFDPSGFLNEVSAPIGFLVE